jgi:hypothetical protein
MVWWKCRNGHEWKRPIYTAVKIRNPCPVCNNQVVHEKNSLAKLNPSVSKYWHPEKNGLLRPKDFMMGSSKRVWWLCKKGHSFQHYIQNAARLKAPICPYCKNQLFRENSIL